MMMAFRIPYRRMAITLSSAVIRLVVVAAACGSLVWNDGSILRAGAQSVTGAGPATPRNSKWRQLSGTCRELQTFRTYSNLMAGIGLSTCGCETSYPGRIE